MYIFIVFLARTYICFRGCGFYKNLIVSKLCMQNVDNQARKKGAELAPWV